jgi:hypothetical protein
MSKGNNLGRLEVFKILILDLSDRLDDFIGHGGLALDFIYGNCLLKGNFFEEFILGEGHPISLLVGQLLVLELVLFL